MKKRSSAKASKTSRKAVRATTAPGSKGAGGKVKGGTVKGGKVASKRPAPAGRRTTAAGAATRAARGTERKVPIALRVDADVLAWFKAQGPGYQTRINAVLRVFMETAR